MHIYIYIYIYLFICIYIYISYAFQFKLSQWKTRNSFKCFERIFSWLSATVKISSVGTGSAKDEDGRRDGPANSLWSNHFAMKVPATLDMFFSPSSQHHPEDTAPCSALMGPWNLPPVLWVACCSRLSSTPQTFGVGPKMPQVWFRT